MLIAFVHSFKAFLPEIEAYRRFFEPYGIETTVVDPEQLNAIQPDVEWRFMGMQTSRGKSGILIHEYASASVPPWRNTKDWIKRRFTVKPDFRLFLNSYVRERISFNDQLPYGFRDMGINTSTPPGPDEQKLYDFIYVGSVSNDMNPDKLLHPFTKQKRTLLVLSKDYEMLQERYRSYPNIIFKGPVPQQEVSRYVSQSRFAINYKPDIAPHNRQTSTKFLEYAACRIPIVSSDFAWMRDFQKQYGGNYFYLTPDMKNLDWEQVNNFQYTFPDLSEWSWEKQIRKSGVMEFLEGGLGRKF